MNKIVTGIALGLGAAFALSGCSVPSTASDEVYVHKGGGPLESQSDKGCVEPATREINSAFDGYFAYPNSQRWYAFTGTPGDDGEPFTVVSKDQQTMVIPGSVSFYLNTDCAVLTRFHDQVGNRKHAYLNDDGTTSQGWTELLNTNFRQPLDATLDRIAKKYTWKDLYSDVNIKDEMNKEVNASLKTLINQQFLGDEEFFVDFSSLLQQPQAPADLVAAVQQEETSKAQAAAVETKAIADAKAAEAAAGAQVAQKNAELRTAKIQAQIKKAEIDAFGGVKSYNDAAAIEKGLNPYQPTILVGAAAGLTK